MDRNEQRVVEDKDLLIERTNKLLLRKGFAPLFGARGFTKGELTQTIKEVSLMNDFTSKDKIVLHFNRFQDTAKMQQYTEHVASHKFPTKMVAKTFIEATIREAWERVPAPSKKWISSTRLALNDWIIITADGPHSLEAIMEAPVDKKYKLPPPYDNYAEQIMAYHWGSHPQINTRSRNTPLTEEEHEQYAPPAAQRKEPKQAASQSPREAPKTAKQRQPASKQPVGDVITLAAICASLGIDAKEARGALRKIDYPKPGSSWQWARADKDKVSKDIKLAVEKARKK